MIFIAPIVHVLVVMVEEEDPDTMEHRVVVEAI
jgi:hypothetical protein